MIIINITILIKSLLTCTQEEFMMNRNYQCSVGFYNLLSQEHWQQHSPQSIN